LNNPAPRGKRGVLKKLDVRKGLKITLLGLPLAGILASAAFPLTNFGRQCMILALLIWLQVYFIFDVFLGGK